MEDLVGNAVDYKGLPAIRSKTGGWLSNALIVGTKKYRYKKTMQRPIAQIFQVLVAATRKRGLQIPKTDRFLYEDNPDCSRISHSDQFRAAILTKEDYECISSLAQNPWGVSSVTKVEENKHLPWTDPLGTSEFLLPLCLLRISYINLSSNTDRLIVPFLKEWTGKPGFTSLQKIGVGLFLSSLGMGVAAIIEVKRLLVARVNQETSNNLPISVFLLIPQFFLVGVGVGFMYTGQLDLFITQSPKGMKTMSTDLFLTTMALGFFFSSLLISIVKKVTTTNNIGWVGESINKGRLDCFYGLEAILIFLDFGFYVLCASWYTSKTILEHNVCC
ncbi:hypothetical protein RND71_031868 [Anisodus tanguticus]|uniref:Uncharacterized protein n=1 Tax=Anisodus tanguticus TaxID=243964 RepID=A0AAE1RDE0_9SOLA|nr:hypothetical protein RND71_031868 [Anisodus tanguticus]